MQLQFFEHDHPEGFEVHFESLLFQLRPHRLLQRGEGWRGFYARADDRLLISLEVCGEGDRAVSPWRAPYAGVACAPAVTAGQLYMFFEFAERQLRQRGFRALQLRLAPHAWFGWISDVESVLLSRGYSLSVAVHAAIPVLATGLWTQMDAWERRKFRQGVRARVRVQRTRDGVYAFLAQCRAERGQQLSLEQADFEALYRAFPDAVLFFEAVLEGQRVAAAVVIRVAQHVAYTFYYGHLRAFDRVSPVVVLLEGIYGWCQAEGIRWLDLGTSEVAGEWQANVFRFKQGMGAVPVSRATFWKRWP